MIFKRSKNKYRKKKIFPDISHLQNFPIPSKSRYIVTSTKSLSQKKISYTRTKDLEKKEKERNKNSQIRKKRKKNYRFRSKRIDKKETFQE